MYRILDFQEPFCWKRKKISINNRGFTLIAGNEKQDVYMSNITQAISMQGFLVSDDFIYLIPPSEGIFEVYDLIFLVTKTGVWFEPI